MNIRLTIYVGMLLAILSNRLDAAEPVRSTAPSFDHLAIYVSDLNKSVAFYKDLFNFDEVKAPFPIARWLVMGNGVMLHVVAGRPTSVDNSKWDHFAIACASMSGMIAELDKKHISWTDIQGKHEPQTRPDGVKQIFIRDPDGYWIELNDSLKPL
jgi:lactoylglutathione lyase